MVWGENRIMKNEDKIIDNVVPDDKWAFNDSVAECFDNMLERSIPQYSVMRESCSSLIQSIFNMSNKKTFNILDIGCSNGLMIESLMNKFGNNDDCDIRYRGIDVSKPMLDKAKFKFLDDIICGKVIIEECDLRNNFPEGIYDAITSVLSIQFTPIEYRQSIIQNIYNNLSRANGCFIMVEKVLGNTDKLNKLFVNNYYDMKRENGYSQEQIDRKRLSLEGVLVPVTNDWNIQLLKQAGFREIDVFWRWMNFVGYIAIK